MIAGDFVGDEQVDIAVLADDDSTHLIENDDGDMWDVVDVSFNPGEMQLVDPYDFAFGDLACDGGSVFVYAGQGDFLAYVGYAKADGFYVDDVRTVGVPAGTFSLAVGDLVPDDAGFLDVVLAGNSHVTVLRNDQGFDRSTLFSYVPLEPLYAEPWDVLIVGTGLDTRLLVPAGNDGDTDPSTPTQLIYSFFIDADGSSFDVDNAMPESLPFTFANPWAMASGDFNGDGDQDVAVAERSIQYVNEGTDLGSTIRFFTYPGNDTDAFTEITAITTGVGVNSLAAADMNCDGYMDLVIGNTGPTMPSETGGAPQIIFGAEVLAGLEAVDVPGITDLGASSRIAIADFDGDLRPEAAIGDFGAGALSGNRVVIVDVN